MTIDSGQPVSLRQRLRELGVVLVSCDLRGRCDETHRPGEDWLVDLLRADARVTEALKREAKQWESATQLGVAQAGPGVWAVPMAKTSRRRRVGYDVALIPTDALVGDTSAEQASKLKSLPPVPESEVPRLARLICALHDDADTLETDQVIMQSVGQQLAESYEEMNLLYTMTQSITEVENPDRFVTIAGRELLATLSYGWIGAQFAEDTSGLQRLSRRLIVAGTPDASADVLRGLSTELLLAAQPNEPLILEPAFDAEHARFAPLGRTVLAHPITREGKVIGVLIAGEKQGDDITVSSIDIKLMGATASHLSIFLENAALYDDLNAMFLGTLEALTSAIDAKDRYTCGHSHRVAHLTQQLAAAIGLDEYTVGRMRIAGLVHDVGKIGVPEIVLTKPGKLTKEEFDLIKKHPEIGHRILKDIPQLNDILPGVLHHHEAWAGGGYPAGIKGEEIPLVARLITLADSFDAMSSTRTYRNAMSSEEVLEEIDRCTGTQFDPELAPIFVKLDFSQWDSLVNEQHEQDLREGRFGGQAA